MPQPNRRPRTKLPPGVDYFARQQAECEPRLATPYVPKERLLLCGSETEGPFPGFYFEIVALSYEEGQRLVEINPYLDIAEAIAPHVRRWNLSLPHPETGEPMPVPPPAVAGPSVLYQFDKGLTVWIKGLLLSESQRHRHLIDAIQEKPVP